MAARNRDRDRDRVVHEQQLLNGDTERVQPRECEYYAGACDRRSVNMVQVLGGDEAPACRSCTREHLEAMPDDTVRRLDPSEQWVRVTDRENDRA